MILVNFEDFLISLFCAHLIALFFVYNSQIEQRSGILLFSDSNLQVANGFLQVLIDFIEQNTQVKVGLEVFRVLLKSFLIQRVYFIEQPLPWQHGLLNAARQRIKGIDIFTV